MKKYNVFRAVLFLFVVFAIITFTESCKINEGAEDLLTVDEIANPVKDSGRSELSTRGSSKKIVAIVWDGAANKKKIDQAFYSAINANRGWSAWKKYWLPGNRYSVSSALKNINELVSDYGVPKSQLTCLLIGKSYGGARTYYMIAKNEPFFDDFAKVAVVLVDPHEPGAPGDKGRANYWYDYVRFRRNCCKFGNYDLALISAWDDMRSKNQIAFYNIYQRAKWPRGYKMSRANYCWKSGADHWSIANSALTVSLIGKAINFLMK